MELFLLLAMALSFVSFISIYLNKPSPQFASEAHVASGKVTPAEYPFQAPEPHDWTLLPEEVSLSAAISEASLVPQPLWVAHTTPEQEEAPIPFSPVGR